MLGSKTKLDTLVLSIGQSWVATFFPRAGSVFYPGTTAECIITDPAGGVLATWEPQSVSEGRIDFIIPPDDHAEIPHGSYYRVTAHYPALGPRPAIDENLSRGSVVRDDNPTPLAAPRSSNIALSFADSMAGPEVDPNWVRVGGWGNLKIWDNHLLSLPNGMAGDFVLFQQTAARYRAQTNQNAVKAEVETVLGAFTGQGKATVIVASNQSMTSWVGYQFAVGPTAGEKKLNIVRGTGPKTYTIEETAANTLADTDRYTLIYDDLADKYLAYKETDLSTPLVRWDDTAHDVPHGNGYRYPALLFESGLLTTGVQFSGWAIKDN
ncbi:LtfC-like domain-containing protein [Mycolicibacterium mageritense]|uniref:LtfC/p132/Gp6 beta-sandwich domain-containing protein n=1 Tax=Mycolicibacterium mageritense TaxID=53462 RepID=A0AAI8U259_MYCME|nr:hypothetical protein [Mycolicibacterium mageritense]BDY33151.1 hypothetical protein hbim_07126 [Mycolicibacterium mageritense]